MRSLLIALASAAILASGFWTEPAPAAQPNDDHRRSMGNLRPDHRTAGPAIQGSPPPGWDRRPSRRPHPDRGDRHDYRPYVPGYRYDVYWPYPYVTPYYYHPYPPPLYIPDGRVYGPQAVRRFLGRDRAYPPAASPRIVVIPEEEADETGEGDQEDEQQAPARRASSDRALASAWRLIGLGDARFSDQEYGDAYQRYRRAAQIAPTLAEAYFRKGLALIALGNYDQAAAVLKQGLDLDPNWARSEFRLDELYGENGAAKTSHLDALAQASAKEPNDIDLLFLNGVMLHFDGQRDRARPFFEQASRFGGPDREYSRGFIAETPPKR